MVYLDAGEIAFLPREQKKGFAREAKPLNVAKKFPDSCYRQG